MGNCGARWVEQGWRRGLVLLHTEVVRGGDRKKQVQLDGLGPWLVGEAPGGLG